MELKGKAIVTFARPYDMANEENSARIQGVTMQYYPQENLLPSAGERGERGKRVIDESLAFNLLDKIESVPGMYELTFGWQSAKSADGKKDINVNKVMDLKFLYEIDITEPKQLKNQ